MKTSYYLHKVYSMRVVQITTAGGKGEQAQEKAGHGLFTTYHLKALDRETDINKDDVVQETKIGVYLRPTMPNASGQALLNPILVFENITPKSVCRRSF